MCPIYVERISRILCGIKKKSYMKQILSRPVLCVTTVVPFLKELRLGGVEEIIM